MIERTPVRATANNPMLAMAGFSDPWIVIGHLATLVAVVTALWLRAPVTPTIVGGFIAVCALHLARGLTFLVTSPSTANAPLSDQGSGPSARTVIVWVFVLLVLPLWAGFFWLISPFQLGPPPTPHGPAVFERVTPASLYSTEYCIIRRRRHLPSLRVLPSETDQKQRYTDAFNTMILEIASHPEGSIVRLYQTRDTQLPEQYLMGAARCAPSSTTP